MAFVRGPLNIDEVLYPVLYFAKYMNSVFNSDVLWNFVFLMVWKGMETSIGLRPLAFLGALCPVVLFAWCVKLFNSSMNKMSLCLLWSYGWPCSPFLGSKLWKRRNSHIAFCLKQDIRHQTFCSGMKFEFFSGKGMIRPAKTIKLSPVLFLAKGVEYYV